MTTQEWDGKHTNTSYAITNDHNSARKEAKLIWHYHLSILHIYYEIISRHFFSCVSFVICTSLFIENKQKKMIVLS